VSSTAALYTPQVLALATSLARFPLGDDLALRGSARSATCGSTIDLGLSCDANGKIEELGLRAHACAIGQASAAIFAVSALGCDAAAIQQAEAEIQDWLGGGVLPPWLGFEAIAAARAYPARHGAILLAWRAALVALNSRG
jgi:NifU-like protein involved in Fe-S cluster formation